MQKINLKYFYYIIFNYNYRLIEYGAETFDDINWEIIDNGKTCEENKEILISYMRENDIFGVKPFK